MEPAFSAPALTRANPRWAISVLPRPRNLNPYVSLKAGRDCEENRRSRQVRRSPSQNRERRCSRFLARCALLSFALLPATSAAEPIKLKLAFFSSDRATSLHRRRQAIRRRGQRRGERASRDRACSSPARSARRRRSSPSWCRDGIADIAYIIPGYTADAVSRQRRHRAARTISETSRGQPCFTPDDRSECLERIRGLLRDCRLHRRTAQHPHSPTDRLPRRLEGAQNPSQQSDRRRPRSKSLACALSSCRSIRSPRRSAQGPSTAPRSHPPCCPSSASGAWPVTTT